MAITINGSVGTYIGSASSVTIRDGKIIINGQETKIPTMPKLTIKILGDVERLDIQHCEKVEITGNAKRVKTNCGSINVQGNIEGDAHTNCGSISCNVVEGDANTNMGSIYKK